MSLITISGDIAHVTEMAESRPWLTDNLNPSHPMTNLQLSPDSLH